MSRFFRLGLEMSFSIDSHIVVMICISVGLWLLTRFVFEKRILNVLRQAEAADYPKYASRLALNAALRHISGCVVLAGAVVIATWVTLNILVPNVPDSDDGLSTLVSLRAGIEEVLEHARAFTLGTWVFLLGFLAALWLFLSFRSTKTKWSSAIEAQHQAVVCELRDLKPDAVRARVAERHPEKLAAFDKDVEALVSANQTALDATLDLPVLSMGADQGARGSLRDLEQFIVAEPVLSEDAPPERQAELAGLHEEMKEGIGRRLRELKREMRFKVVTLTGERDVSVDAAERDIRDVTASKSVQTQRLRDLMAEAELERYNSLATSQVRSEPELFREWVTALLSSEKAVRGAGFLGKLARVAVIVVLITGLVGVSAKVNGPNAVAQLRNIELTMAGRLSDAEFAKTMAGAADDSVDDEVELASDADTEIQLANAMRESVALAIQAGHLGAATRTITHRQRFELGAVGARQEILRSSARVAPTRAVMSAAVTATFRASTPSVPKAAAQFEGMLQQSIDRRIERMRAHEPTWRKMRAAAVRPASRDLVSKQFFKAVFPGDRLPAPGAMQLWVDRATVDVARNAVRSGSIPSGYTAAARVDAMPGIISDRDRRVVRDASNKMPHNVSSHIDRVNTGRVDAGSLHRSAPSPIRGTPVTSTYARTFPTNTSARGGGGVNARSYSSIRFNRRVGGVVIGRNPFASEIELSIVEFRAEFRRTLRGEVIEIMLVPEVGSPIYIGAFHPAIAHHALAYAADGRVVAATLPQIQQESDGGHQVEVPTRPVVVHPAFEDTTFACAAIEIDRFVDDNMYGGLHAQAEAMIAARDAVTRFGRALEVAPSGQFTAASIGDYLQDVQAYVQSCGATGTCFPVEDYAKAGLNFSGAQELLSCMARNSDVAASCRSNIILLNNSMAYSVDSGVREQPYTLDAELRFLRLDAHRGDPLWPMDFIVQAVPVSLHEGEGDLPDDLDPWVFPVWGDDLRAMVELYVKVDVEAGQVLNHMQQFTVLQRMFRLALDGTLGVNFPIEKLIEMHEATKPFVNERRHEHWNFPHASPPSQILDFFDKEAWGLRSALSELTRSRSETLCGEKASALLDLSSGQSLPEDADLWSGVLEVAAVCEPEDNKFAPSNLTQRVEALHRLNLIEEALSVHAAHGIPSPLGCPPL
ncbi:hypothetical protein [Pelagimonas phthalicica]|uniref:hypothetical protein n=1 Tax=Pelagimonas phthalicica TaxID=1037362 RepID=UPI00105CD110|nr:hypothetical protein [Pelagimonas phthalicica]